MVFEKGSNCHLYFKGYELYQAVVTENDGKNLTVSYSGGADRGIIDGKRDNRQKKGTMKNLPLIEMKKGEAVKHPDAKDLGDEVVVLGEMDPDFAPEGFMEMTEMRKLNDCELAKNLEVKFRLDPQPPSTSYNQAIVITGESGAGKTFQTKQVLDFLAYVGADPSAPPDAEKVTDVMLATMPILEGFGNANMPRNPDSSRFGKLFKVFFDRDSKLITGCDIEPYMLEKSRVSSQQIMERNYHTFYRMIFGKWGQDGLFPDGKEKFKIKNVMHYEYLKGGSMGGPCRIPDANVIQNIRREAGKKDIDFEDEDWMPKMMKAMTTFFDDEKIDELLKVTMGSLWIGNVKLKAGKNDSSEVIKVGGSSEEAVAAVCELWQIDPAALEKAITKYSVDVRGKWTEKEVSVRAAYKQRDAIGRTVYDMLFNYQVFEASKKLNSNVDENNDRWLGVLDIFGFEFVQTNKICEFVDKYEKDLDLEKHPPSVNSFDQFCINLCNEQLQQHFVNVIFGQEQHLYETQLGEKIDIHFDKNDDTVELITKNKTGIISKLDEIALHPPRDEKGEGIADSKFYDVLKKMKHKRIKMTSNRGKNAAEGGTAYYGKGFDLEHYAATVRYDVRDWVDKDADKLPVDVYMCLSESGQPFISETFAMDNAATGPKIVGMTGGGKTQACVAGAFKGKLAGLIQTLETADSNFVRCIKCSNPLQRGVYWPSEVLNQLRYTGMLDTLLIRRAGFAMRMTYQAFMDTYHVLVPGDPEDVNALVEYIKDPILPTIIAKMGPLELADIEHQKSADGTYDAIRMGHGEPPLILARDWLDRSLDEQRRKILSVSAIVIQNTYRGCYHRKQYARQEAAWSMQACMRAANKAKPYYNIRTLTCKLQPEVHAFTGRVIAGQSADMAELKNGRNEMKAFIEENKLLEQMEADERKLARAEDEYSWQLMDATFGERVGADKKRHKDAAEVAYKAGMAKVEEVKAFLDTVDKKGAESDARWQRMQTEGEVRSVPLVRQYTSEAANFVRPSKDAYRFKYSFSYKGAKALNKGSGVSASGGAGVDISGEIDVSGGIEVDGSLDVDVKAKMPKMELEIKAGAKVELELKAPKVEMELKVPKVEIKMPKVEIKISGGFGL